MSQCSGRSAAAEASAAEIASPAARRASDRDQDLLRLRGLGPATLRGIRAALDVYYWRGEDAESRAAWERYVEHHSEGSWVRRCAPKFRSRAVSGCVFARDVLGTSGGILRDNPAAARMMVA